MKKELKHAQQKDIMVVNRQNLLNMLAEHFDKKGLLLFDSS